MDDKQMQQIQQLIQAADQGNQEAIQMLGQLIQQQPEAGQALLQIAQQMGAQNVVNMLSGGQTQSMRNGAKIQYLKYLKGQCPNGYEIKYFKVGGKVCKKCLKKKEEGGNIQQSVSEYKCGRKMKKKACGGTVNKKK